MKKILLAMLALFAAPLLAEDISTSGWRLWPDPKAAWKDDAIFLPAEVKLDKLPVNAPTGGWKALDAKQGIPVSLPTTVEEHYWGKFGTRPYTLNEAQRGKDTTFPNGNYLGVSWWWRQVQVPAFQAGQRLKVSFRGARLRAEVYCNQKLVGYTIMGELPFEADITDAVKPGEPAQLALRITNPGGHLDWIDFSEMAFKWGSYILPPSHGFGGLDAGIQMQVRDAAEVRDLAVINKPDLEQVKLLAEVASLSKPYQGSVQFRISRNGKEVWSAVSQLSLAAGETRTVEVDAKVEGAGAWDVKHPNLYKASADLIGLGASFQERDFGFRFFTAEGIGGSDAKLTLNGKRTVLISAISWGFWGRNGIWPDQEMAEREVVNAKALGLNCLQFHRNVGKTAILEQQDRLGLLRYEESGGGKFALGARYGKGPFEFGENGKLSAAAFEPKESYVQPDKVDTSGTGPDAEAKEFWEKYQEEKILMMVKRDRSHPSLIMYNIQNESDATDLRNPRIYKLFRDIHALDPSRPISLYSGGQPRDNQVLMLPYSDEIRYGSKTLPYAGWRDIHTCGGPTNYMDHLYKDPKHFFQKSKARDAASICVWGEMLGSGCPDDYEALVKSFDAKHPHGYELDDAKKVLKGYNDYLDKWGFRKAFPTASSLFRSIGDRTYYFWQRIVAQSRADNVNDFLVISGWESTTIDNHSGLVDNQRRFKGDPALLAKSCAEELILIQPRKMIVGQCSKEVVDLFLINETGRKGLQTLKFTARRPDKSVAFESMTQVAISGGDTYGQLLAEGLEFIVDAPGLLELEAVLSPGKAGDSLLSAKDQVYVVPSGGTPLLKKVAVLEPENELVVTMKEALGIEALKLAEAAATEKLDAIVLGSKAVDGGTGVDEAALDSMLKRVKEDGTRLIFWPDQQYAAEAFAKALAKRQIVSYEGTVGNLDAPWFGSWFFGRKHWLLDGLASDSSLDWRWGVSAFGGPAWMQEDPKGAHTDGLLISAPGMEAFIGYGADHNPKVGTSGLILPYGKGQIVIYVLPQLLRSLQPGNYAMNLNIARRLLANALSDQKAAKQAPEGLKGLYFCDDAVIAALTTPVPEPATPPSSLDIKKVKPGSVISIDFSGGSSANGSPKPMGPKERAGVVEMANWNHAPEGTGKLAGLKDGAGKATTVSLSWDSRNTWASPIPDKPGNSRMMKGYLDTSDVSSVEVKVSGLPEAFTAKGYRVYAYYDGDEQDDKRKAKYAIAKSERIGTDPAGSFFKGRFSHAWDSDAAVNENYVVLEGLKEGSFTLKATPVDSDGANFRAPLSGIQIVAEP